MAASTPPRSTSRFSQMLNRARSPSLDQRSFSTPDVENGPAAGAEVRSPSRPRIESSVVGSFSSSMAVPARSYFQRSVQSPHAPIDTHQTTSKDIRADTAELASRALIEAATPTGRSFFQQLYFESDAQPSPSRDVSRKRSSMSVHRPEIIPEAPEPISPAEASSGPGKRASMLTQLIKNSPPEDLEAALADTASEGESEADDFSAVTVRPGIISQPHERTSLLPDKGYDDRRGYGSERLRASVDSERPGPRTVYGQAVASTQNGIADLRRSLQLLASPNAWNRKVIWHEGVVRPASYLPAVLLGLLLNVLDALSYGMILFPLGQPLFADLGPDGISMFYVSCIISQLVYSLGGSIFRGGVGSEMIEVVPFFHKMAFTIMQQVGAENREAVLATTVLSYSLSSVLTGAVFFLLGQCRLGVLIGFFPRHILVGCIGGVGFFLVVTGIEVSARLEGNLEYNMATLRNLFAADTAAHWITPLALAISLLVLKKWVKHSLADAAWFISIIVVFYILIAAIPSLSIEDLRDSGWIFEAPAAGAPWYHFYTLYNFSVVDWGAIASTIPAMFALTFFGVLHVPINVPALGVSTGEDNVDVDRELKAHGYSNALSGFAGSIQNYLVYTNTVLFMRSGGDSRLAGILLAGATFGILLAGPALIGYIPVVVVGTLIYFLGLDLMREAVVDTIGRVHRLEYLTIIIIVVTMGAYDFVVGILAGIVLACVSFVLQTSQISAIRGTLPGGVASSTVRRHPLHYHYLQEVGRQVYVMKLAGYLFFGTIVGVENSIREVLRDEAFNSRPVQFLVLDLYKVDGVDFSAAEAFTRINRILTRRDVRMVICGFSLNSDVGKSLCNVGLLDSEEGVEYFEGLNSALEYCENELLKAFYDQRAAASGSRQNSVQLDVPEPAGAVFPPELAFNSPRRGALHTAAANIREQERAHQKSWQGLQQPLHLIVQTFASLSDRDVDFWSGVVPYFKRREIPAGTVVYRSGDDSDAFYLLEKGILKAKYWLPQGSFSEVIVAGATCGELPFFSETRRTSTTFAERDCVVWLLEMDGWERCQKEREDVSLELLKVGLKLTSERMEAVTKYMLLAGT